MDSASLAPVVTPRGRLAMVQMADAPHLDPVLVQRLRGAFDRGSGHGLLQLGAAEIATILPPVLSYWREFAECYVTALCTQTDTLPSKRSMRPFLPLCISANRFPGKLVFWLGRATCSIVVAAASGPRLCLTSTLVHMRPSGIWPCSAATLPVIAATFRYPRSCFHQARDVSEGSGVRIGREARRLFP
jgi:hypothetical protein